jgi:hypothetical protein
MPYFFVHLRQGFGGQPAIALAKAGGKECSMNTGLYRLMSVGAVTLAAMARMSHFLARMFAIPF